MSELMTTVVSDQLTAEEYARVAPEGYPTELVRGRIVRMNPPSFFHGFYCGQVDYLVGGHIRRIKWGWAITNDAGVITERDPDTVRGADVAFYSFARVPKKSRFGTYPDVPPDFLFEVLSPGNTERAILEKIAEYLAAGVNLVCVLDPETETVGVCTAHDPDRILTKSDRFELPDLLPGLSVAVAEFFE